MNCPKCGFSQPEDYYCANCGVNVEKYVQKRKKRGYGIGIAIVLIGISAIAVTKYVQTTHRTEEAETISRAGQEKSGSALKQTARTDSRVQRTVRTQRPERKRGAGGRKTEEGSKSSRSTTETLSERGIAEKPSPEAAEQEVKARQKEAPLTGRQWFQKGRALDDDSEPEIESYQKAIELDPAFAPAYYHLGAIYYRRADYDRADEEFVKFLSYASEEERQEYDIYLFYSDADVEELLGNIEQEVPTPEETSEEATPELGAEETEESGPESSVETEQEVQTIVRFTSYKGQIIVPVVLNGSVTTNVLLDTGAGITIISTDLSRHLGLKVAREKGVKLRTIAAEVEAPLARLDSIELGNFARDNFLVAVSDLELGEGRKFEGILGMDFLNNYTIQIDNRNSRVLLSPSQGSRQ